MVRLLPCVLLVLTALAACSSEARRGDPNLQMELGLEPDPPTVGTAAVQVGLAEVDWTPRNGDRVILMGSRDEILLTQDTAVGQGAGIYRAEAFPFPVAGEWILTVRVETRDGRWAEVDHPLRIVATEP